MIFRIHHIATSGGKAASFFNMFHSPEWMNFQATARQRKKKKSSKAAWRSSYNNLLMLWEYWKSVETYHCCCLQSDPWLKKWRWLALDTLCVNTSFDIMMERERATAALTRYKRGWWCSAIDALCAFQGPFIVLLPSFTLSSFCLDHSDSCTAIITTAMINFLPLATLAPALSSAISNRPLVRDLKALRWESLWQYSLVSCFIFFHPCRISSRGSALICLCASA